jgi:hypothetical protein
MNQDITVRARRIAAQSFPGVPFQISCSWAYSRTLEDGRFEFKCSHCGNTQITTELLGAMEERACRGTTR